MIDLINRLLNPIKTKIYMMISHAVVHEIENRRTVDGSTVIHPNQRLRIQCLSGDHVSEIHRIQEYGLETYPVIDNSNPAGGEGFPEAVAVFINGNKDQGLVIKVGDRRYRITDLAEGEVALYTKWNEESGEHNITLKTGQEIEMNGVQLDINMTNDVDITAPTVSITTSSEVSVDGDINLASGKVLKNNDLQVVGAQGSYIAPSDGTPVGNKNAVNAVILALETHGLITDIAPP